MLARNIHINENLANISTSKLKLDFNDSNAQSVRTFEETFNTFLLSALYWLADNSCDSIKNSLSKNNFFLY